MERESHGREGRTQDKDDTWTRKDARANYFPLRSVTWKIVWAGSEAALRKERI